MPESVILCGLLISVKDCMSNTVAKKLDLSLLPPVELSVKNSDLKKGFKFLYLFVRVVSHLGLFGLPIFYSGYDLNNAGEWLLIAQFLMLMISGIGTIIFVTLFFIIFHHIETRYFKGSYRMAYILFKYILPFTKGQIECFDYELVSQGYKEVVKRGDSYYGIEDSDK